MAETHYMISDAARKVDVEAHVLRYWEEELELNIPRNEMGHRYYTEEDIEKFAKIKELKEQGYQLKVIKMFISNIMTEDIPLDMQFLDANEDEISNQDDNDNKGMELSTIDITKEPKRVEQPQEDKMEQFKNVLGGLLAKVLEANNADLEREISDIVIKEFDYLMRIREEEQDQKFQHLEEILKKYLVEDEVSILAQQIESSKKSLDKKNKFSGFFRKEKKLHTETV